MTKGSSRPAFNHSSVDIATKAERDHRVQGRAKPVVERHLTPGGWVETRSTRVRDAANENRINHLNLRLDNAKALLRNGHGKARIRGSAKQAFDRGR